MNEIPKKTPIDLGITNLLFLIPSYPNLSYPILSFPILSFPILFYPIVCFQSEPKFQTSTTNVFGKETDKKKAQQLNLKQKKNDFRTVF